MIDGALIAEVTGARSDDYAQLGLVNTTEPGSLSFLDQAEFADALVVNEAITGAFVTADLAKALRGRREGLALIEHDDPRWAYYSLYNCVGKRDYRLVPTFISPSAFIHPTASIAENNVEIGDNCVVGPMVAILPDVNIGKDCVIQAGTVIGSVGFELKRTSRGILSVFHDGIVEIGERVEIGANSCIDKGFRGRPTVIGDEARVDNLVHVAHSVRIGAGSFVIAGTVLGGSTTIGEEAWLSINSSVAPGASVGDGAFVSIGAVVTRDVEPGAQVTGNFAVPHQDFLRILKRNLTSAKDVR